MNERNHWITFPNHFVVRWGAFLQGPRGDGDALARFAAGVIDAGVRQAVFSPVRLPDFSSAGDGPITAAAYADNMRAQMQRHGRVSLFSGNVGPGPKLWTQARLAYFRGDEIVEEEVGDVGALLQTLRPDVVERGGMFMRGAPPIAVEGMTVPLSRDQEVRVEIRLDTDIWFPRVMGILEEAPEEGDLPEAFDNHALAERHTPRLNAFLNEVRTLTVALGGRWEVLEVDPFGADYAPMWNEGGILL